MSRQILVIGGNSGIGAATVACLQGRGDQVVTASRHRGEGDVSWQPFDAAGPDADLELPERLDGVVYCPGSITLKPFHRLSDEEFESEWRLNFLGAVRTIRMALPALKKSDHASIVLFSTVAVGTGLSYHASIAGAKGAVEGLVRSLAAEFAPRIRVNAIAPSLTDTPLAGSLLSTEEKRNAAAQRHPLHRVGSPTEIAEAVAFLIGAESGFMTGQIIRIDGGLSTVKPL